YSHRALPFRIGGKDGE
ncbi:hypothetical protein CP8484711_0925B, partial [Chlamydia psittaci 84-8471/1]